MRDTSSWWENEASQPDTRIDVAVVGIKNEERTSLDRDSNLDIANLVDRSEDGEPTFGPEELSSRPVDLLGGSPSTERVDTNRDEGLIAQDDSSQDSIDMTIQSPIKVEHLAQGVDKSLVGCVVQEEDAASSNGNPIKLVDIGLQPEPDLVDIGHQPEPALVDLSSIPVQMERIAPSSFMVSTATQTDSAMVDIVDPAPDRLSDLTKDMGICQARLNDHSGECK